MPRVVNMRMTSNESNLNYRLFEAVRLTDIEKLQSVIRDFRSYPYGSCRLEFDKVLCIGAQKGHSEIVRLLLRTKAGVTYVDKEGRRALHYAAEIGSADIVKQIINAGSPANVVDASGATALHFAADFGHDDVVLLLLQEGAHVNRARLYSTGETPLHLACKSGRLEVVKLLVARGADINVTTSVKQQTPLHLACRGRHHEIVRLLCQLGVDVNKQDFKNETPLIWAATNSALDISQTLLSYNANLLIADSEGCTALHHIAGHGKPTHDHIEIARMIIQRSCDLDPRDAEGKTPLHHCAVSDSATVASLLIGAGAEIDVMTHTTGETPLNRAVKLGCYRVAKILVSAGADVTIADFGKATPLHNIQSSKGSMKMETVEALIEAGASLNCTTQRGYTILDRCTVHYVMGDRENSIEVLKTLVAAGTHLKPMARGGRPLHQSPLCWLTWHGCLKVARFLVNVGWDLNNESWINLPGKTDAADEFLEWLRKVNRQPRSLWSLCRKSIRGHLILTNKDRDITPSIHDLPLPTFLKRQLMFEEECQLLDLEQAD